MTVGSSPTPVPVTLSGAVPILVETEINTWMTPLALLMK